VLLQQITVLRVRTLPKDLQLKQQIPESFEIPSDVEANVVVALVLPGCLYMSMWTMVTWISGCMGHLRRQIH